MVQDLFRGRYAKGIILSLLLVVVYAGCSKTAGGGVFGGILGGSLGALIGKRTGNTAAGVIIGSAIGGAAGAAIGNYMDKQAAELEEDLENAKVERVGEGIKITFDSGILFKFDSSTLTADAGENVREMADVLKKYDDTNILVQGYTDSIGTKEYNQELSEERALSVAEKLIALDVDNDRLKVEGYGEQMPVADNSTPRGRAQNRRVEIAVYANERLKEAAAKNKDLETI
ncbi:MAG: OmpA family protein [Chitinivibrionales bacterium]|nr:OmpA family protein [Chitinivibrionales bacterium]